MKANLILICLLIGFGTVSAQQTVLGIHSNETGAARAFRTVDGNAWGGFSGDSIFFRQSPGGPLMETMNAAIVASTTGLFGCMQGPATGNQRFRMGNACNIMEFWLVSTSVSEITLNLVRAANQPVAVNNWVTVVRFSPDRENWTNATFTSTTVPVRGVEQTATYGCFIITVQGLNIPAGNFVEIRTNATQIFVEAVVTPAADAGELTSTVYPASGDTIPNSGFIDISFNRTIASFFCSGSVLINGLGAFADVVNQNTFRIFYDEFHWNSRDTLRVDVFDNAIFDVSDPSNGLPFSLYFVRVSEDTGDEDPRQFTVTVTPSDLGDISVMNNGVLVTSGSQVDSGTVLVLTAIPHPTPAIEINTFQQWWDGNRENPREIRLDSNLTISASFAITSSVLPIISESVSIHPNPVLDVLYVEAENLKTIEIIDMLGRVVLQKMAPSSNKNRIDVNHLREGLHFIRLTLTDGRVMIERFIKH